MRTRASLLVAALILAGCRPPKAEPLQGIAPVSAHLPVFEVPPGQRIVEYKWELLDGDAITRGQGVARISGPDTARVDLFLTGIFGGRGASAIMIGDSLRFPPGATMTELVPPPTLLWAAFGRLAIPPATDTIIRVSGDTLRAAVGLTDQWRVTAISGRFTRLERVAGGRIVESLDRDRSGKRVRYQSSSRRSLTLEFTKDIPAAPFDASIWRY